MKPEEIRERFKRIDPTFREVDEDGFDALDESDEEWAERLAAEEAISRDS